MVFSRIFFPLDHLSLFKAYLRHQLKLFLCFVSFVFFHRVFSLFESALVLVDSSKTLLVKQGLWIQVTILHCSYSKTSSHCVCEHLSSYTYLVK